MLAKAFCLQPPSNGEEDDDNVADTNDLPVTDNSKQRRIKLVPRHSVSNDPKKPWRDPDPCPSDTHYRHLIDSSTMAMYSR